MSCGLFATVNTRARLVFSIGLLAAAFCIVHAPFIHTYRSRHYVADDAAYWTEQVSVIHEWVWTTPDLSENETTALDWRRLGAELLTVAAVAAAVGLLQSLIPPLPLQRFFRNRKVNDAGVTKPRAAAGPAEPSVESANAGSSATPRVMNLRRNLLTKAMGNRSTFDRLLAYEQSKAPGIVEEELLERAIARWERDNR